MPRRGRHGLADGPAGVVVTPVADLAIAAIALRGGAASLAARLTAIGAPAPPARPRCASAGSDTIVWTGPGQWLLLRDGLSGAARHAVAPALAEALGEAASVTEMTGSRVVLDLAGPAVRDALAKLLPLDLAEEAFPAGSAAATGGNYMPLLVWRPPGAAAAFRLACYRSYGESLVAAVLDAAREYGCELL